MRKSTEHRERVQRSGKWLRRARKLYVRFCYDTLASCGTEEERNKVLDRMAIRYIEAGYVVKMPNYRRDLHGSQRNGRRSIISQFHRLWAARNPELVHHRSWSWSCFCYYMGYSPCNDVFRTPGKGHWRTDYYDNNFVRKA